MTSANSLNLPPKIFLAIVMALSAVPSVAHAQYTPPPMFDDMGSNSARPSADSGNIVEPKASVPTPYATPPVAGTQRPPIIAPRVSVDPDKNPPPVATPYVPRMAPIIEPKKPARKISRAPAPAMVPPKKPAVPVAVAPATTMTPDPAPIPAPVVSAPPQVAAPTPVPDMTEPIYKPEPVYSPVVKPSVDAVPSPAPVPTPRGPNEPMPAYKVKSQGVVTGPKTMPAVPTTSVDQVETFDDSAVAGEQTILERHLKATKKKAETAKAKEEATLTPVPALPKPVAKAQTGDVPDMPSDPAPVISFDDAKPEIMKKILPYQAGQIDLAKDDLDAIAAGVKSELNAKPDWRIQIRSFATPQGEGLGSDRRIALSRALSIRTALVAGGIDASVIDLRADGLQTDESQTGDRVDLYLYNPAEPAQTP